MESPGVDGLRAPGGIDRTAHAKPDIEPRGGITLTQQI
jgi:hypothetical protein